MNCAFLIAIYIYDNLTKTMHISGFRAPWSMDAEPFSDVTYVLWGLTKRSERMNWELDSSDWTW
ncbi:uncharacterized protein N7529_001050 [Penicillium soppii]|uniref:uncharacterized protein n=1 Tax=Penicillium soppii TaxID=69789 RepID=UPI0025473E6E|nr:uncharacterized protein N7529_001050 [Penicillium soppii]KAJ5882378.1 hypothetical protein N7529_001050 [Penicillium soppii]